MHGNSINYEVLKKDIIEIFEKHTMYNYKLNPSIVSPKEINVEEIIEKVSRDATNAYYDKEKNVYSEGSVGYRIDKDELQKELNKPENKIEGATIVYPITIVQPEVTLKDLGYDFYKDKLSGYTTYFTASDKARSNNLKIAMNSLNETVIMPGETFSFNNVIGEVTSAKGYLSATTFKGGTTVEEVGGGICQISSTLYNAALLANLNIIERYAHGLTVGYVLPSRDATIYTGILDFKFNNNREYPIKILATYDDTGSVNISLYGTREEVEYDIEITSETLYNVKYDTNYIYDEKLEEGKTVVEKEGSNGLVSQSYIVKSQAGKVISRTLLSKDTYSPVNRVVRVGTKPKDSDKPSATATAGSLGERDDN